MQQRSILLYGQLKAQNDIYNQISDIYKLEVKNAGSVKIYSLRFKTKVTFGHNLRYKTKGTFGEISLRLRQMN
jgi:hypothetical protein